jgi:hypothetical protein
MDLHINEQFLFCGGGFEDGKDINFQSQRKDRVIEEGHQVGEGGAQQRNR